MRGLAILAALVALPVWAAEPATSMSSASMGAQLSKLMLGLLLVIGLIFLLAWLLRRVQQLNPRGTQVIKLISTQALGPRERLVLVQVGGEQVHEGRVGLPAGLQQRGEVVLAELGLGERREHPRRGMGGPGHGVRAPGGVQLGGDQGDGVACGAQTHGGGEADDPGPDDGHVHGPVLLTAV